MRYLLKETRRDFHWKLFGENGGCHQRLEKMPVFACLSKIYLECFQAWNTSPEDKNNFRFVWCIKVRNMSSRRTANAALTVCQAKKRYWVSQRSAEPSSMDGVWQSISFWFRSRISESKRSDLSGIMFARKPTERQHLRSGLRFGWLTEQPANCCLNSWNHMIQHMLTVRRSLDYQLFGS